MHPSGGFWFACFEQWRWRLVEYCERDSGKTPSMIKPPTDKELTIAWGHQIRTFEKAIWVQVWPLDMQYLLWSHRRMSGPLGPLESNKLPNRNDTCCKKNSSSKVRANWTDWEMQRNAKNVRTGTCLHSYLRVWWKTLKQRMHLTLKSSKDLQSK